MPEGPEVKLSADLIRPLVENKMINKILLGDTGRYRSEDPENFKIFHNSFRKITDVGCIVSEISIKNIYTKGKFMYWEFSNGWYMFSTFGMSGQWSPHPGKHVCLNINLYNDNGSMSNIYFNDPRHFGTIKFTNNKKELTGKLNELGWDPLADKLDDQLANLVKAVNKTIKPIGQILMDQSVFSGVGNYIKCESLYKSKISPWRQGNLMSHDDITNLCKNIIEVMEESYKYQGATIFTYKTAYGEEGKYSGYFKVYGKKYDLHGNKIIKETTPDNRTTHWCPSIQK